MAKIKQLHKVVREFRLLRDGLVDVKETLLALHVAQTEYSKSSSPTTPTLDTQSVKELSEKSKKTYGHFSDYGSIYRVDMVMICTYKVRISFRSGL